MSIETKPITECTKAMREYRDALMATILILKKVCCQRVRIRTGIAPKWSNRTRRKQRPTRLQRRAKRQNG